MTPRVLQSLGGGLCRPRDRPPGRSRDVSDPTRRAAFLTPAPVRGSLTSRLLSPNGQRIRHAVASCFAPANRARHSPRRSSRQTPRFRTKFEGSFLREKECRMPLIKPRTRGKQIVRHIARLDRENAETLHAYAAFLGESTDYVLNQVIDTVLAKDKDFVKWRADHAHSHLPSAASRPRRNRGMTARHSVSAVVPPSAVPVSMSMS